LPIISELRKVDEIPFLATKKYKKTYGLIGVNNL